MFKFRRQLNFSKIKDKFEVGGNRAKTKDVTAAKGVSRSLFLLKLLVYLCILLSTAIESGPSDRRWRREK
jgi:hypothetical protein